MKEFMTHIPNTTVLVTQMSDNNFLTQKKQNFLQQNLVTLNLLPWQQQNFVSENN
jgi:hypothetical protein